MRSHRPARVTVTIWTSLLAGLRSRVAAAGVAAVLLTGGLAAAPAVTAHAASVAPAGRAISVPGLGRLAGTAKVAAAVTTAATTIPSQIVDSVDFTSYSPAEMTAAVDYWWPESLFMRDYSSLGDILTNTWFWWHDQNPPSEWLPAQPQASDFAGATISVTSDGGTGSILTFTVPTPPSSGTVTTTGIDTTLAAVFAQLIGAASSVAVMTVCGAFLFGLPTTDLRLKVAFANARPWAQKLCGSLAGAVWAATATESGTAMTTGDAPSSGFPWPVVGAFVGNFVGSYSSTYAGPAIKVVQYAWLGLALWIASNAGNSIVNNILGFLSPFLSSAEQDNFEAILNGLVRAQYQQISSPLAAAKLFGFWTPVASGYVGNVPSGGAVTVGSGDCMDAYGSNGNNEPASPPAIPGQSVAINACNGNPAQVFDFWPNGQIEVWGLCMDDNGDTYPYDTPVVNLQLCDGGYTQLWYENSAGEIVNAATGNCLDDPAGNTTAGTQLIVHPCNGGANQLWVPPNGADAVTGFGAMFSVQSTGSFHLCMMPQTTLTNPVGSNIITEPSNSDVCGRFNLPRMWALGSNGTLMANGTNTLCMDSDGPATTGPGGEAAYFVQLQGCNGSQSQVWKLVSTYVGPTLQNAADGLCINTPNGQLTWVVSMIVASCANPPYAGELWTLPGVSVPSGSSSGGPCDIYASYGTPCVAAYGMTRALYGNYNGPLYQVQRASDGATSDIGLVSVGGDVNAGEQDSFCANTTCAITKIYDQSPEGNTLTIEGAGGAAGADRGANAAALPVTIGGNEAYGLDVESGVGYRDNSTTGVATGSAPEGMYMVASGTHVNSGCCYDFGNAETNTRDNGAGHMDAVNLTTWCGSNSAPCAGSGPWVEADMENGQWLGNGPNPNNTGNSSSFVTAVLKDDGSSQMEMEGGDSTSGGLSNWYNGGLPPGYSPMAKEGAIVLGTGGDNSNADVGSFFEGVMTSGFPSDAADAAVQANIVAAGYSGNTNPPSSGAGAAPASVAGQAVVHSAGATGAGAAGFSSVYTVDSSNGHLQETYLPYMFGPWTTQDLSAQFGTPPVMPGTQPVSIVHCGFTSVYTVDASDGDLQETYLPAIGVGWNTQDLSANYGTPPTNVTPTAVEHYAGATGASPGCGFTSVYTRDRNGDLQETYLPNAGFPGDPWTTQDLSVNYGAPQILEGTSPVAIVHCGFTSVYTVDAGSDHLQETYLPYITAAWNSQDLSVNYGTPPTTTTPTAVEHYAGATGASDGCGFTSVYTVDRGSGHLQETYLPNAGFPGDPWTTQDLSVNYGTPPVASGTQPVAVVHMNFTSVYTIDGGTNHLQETYLPYITAAWNTQDLTVNYAAPVTDQSPIVLLHPDASGNMDWTSVFTVSEFSGELMETYLPNSGFPGDGWITQDLSQNYGTPVVYVQQSSQSSWSVDHDGYTSVYTADSGSGDLRETYLPTMGGSWNTQDLTKTFGTPPLAANDAPSALFHDGYTSVFTIDGSNHDLRETYLPAAGFPGDPWLTQDLSQIYGTPRVADDTSPTSLFHDSNASVFTIDAGSGDLQETYLPGQGFPGDPWITQDLSKNYGTPKVMAQTCPVAIYHDGDTSVFTIDAGSGDLQETYLPAMGGPWFTQDLTRVYGTPTSGTTPTAVFHDGVTSVYTASYDHDLQETYLPAMGDSWVTQDLTQVYGAYRVLTGVTFAPVAIYHDGYTSVYYTDYASKDLVESYLPTLGGPWQWQDLTAKYGAPPSGQTVSPLVHYAANGGLTWTSLFTVNANGNDLQETYLPNNGFPGDPWITQDLSSITHAPPV